jgi:hypothetical protein
MTIYKREITLPSQSDDCNGYENDVKLEVSYDSKTCEYVAILKIGKNDVYKEYQIFYFKVPYEHKYGFVNLREIFKNSHLDYDYSTYISNKDNNIDLMSTIIQLFEMLQNEIIQDETNRLSNRLDVVII